MTPAAYLARRTGEISGLVLLRHGESVFNRDGRFAGWSDTPLSPRGQQEAERAGRLLKAAGFRFDACFTSELQRAHETLRIVLEAMGQENVPVQRHWRLNERHNGALEDLGHWEALWKFGPGRLLACQLFFHAPPPRLDVDDPRFPGNQTRYAAVDPDLLPRGESMQEVLARVRPYWEDALLPAIHPGGRVMIVAHHRVLRMIRLLLEGLPRFHFSQGRMANARPLVYDLDAARRPIQHFYLDR